MNSNKDNFLQKIFSIKNSDMHKVFTILGLKFKFKNYKKTIKEQEWLIQDKENVINRLKIVDNSKILNNVGELLGLSKISNKEILKKNLTQIEIEIFSYCNRQCWFCPNSFIDRHSENHFMDEENYLNILRQLGEIDYSNIITYSRYNEPLSNREIFIKRLKQARSYCPNAFIRTNSNGDFLTSKEYLDELASAGLNEMEVQCYLSNDEEFSKDLFLKKTENFSKRIGNLEYHINDYGNWIIANFHYDKLNLSYAVRNFKEVATNRGGSLDTDIPEYNRKEPCTVPFQHLYIDYTGDVMLCCNFRHDIDKHKPFIIGNAFNESLSDIFMGEKIINYRKLLSCYGEKINPCSSCRFIPGTERMNLIGRVM